MKRLEITVAPIDERTADNVEQHPVFLDPDVVALSAGIEVILYAALAPAPRPPAPPATGSALAEPRPQGWRAPNWRVNDDAA